MQLGRSLSFGHMPGMNVPTPGAVRIDISGQEAPSGCGVPFVVAGCKPVVYEVQERKPAELDINERAWSELKEEVITTLRPLAQLRYQMNLCAVAQPFTGIIALVCFAVFVNVGMNNGNVRDSQGGAFDVIFLVFVPSVLCMVGQAVLSGRYNNDLNSVLQALGSSLSAKHGATFRAAYDVRQISQNRSIRIAYLEYVPPNATAQMPTATAVPMMPTAVAYAQPMSGAPVVQAQATPMGYGQPTAPVVVAATPLHRVENI